MGNRDSILFKQIKEGNKTAFDILFNSYYTALCKFAYSICLHSEHSEEIVQQVFIKLWEQACCININSSVKAYLFQCVRNTALNLLKSEQTRKKYEYKPEQLIYDAPSSNLNHKQILAFKAALLDAVDKLPDKCKEIFCLCKYGNFTYKETSEILSISVKTVENQMTIAMKKLHLIMKDSIAEILHSF